MFGVLHFLFADDTQIFYKASKDQMTHLCWLLMWFEFISSLKINLDKSELFLVGMEDDTEDLIVENGCKVGSLPSTYLGLPLGASFKLVVAWGWNRRETLKEINYVEEVLHFKGLKDHFDSKHDD